MSDLAATAVVSPQLLTTAEAARIFACSERTIRRWIAAGHLAPVRIGRTVRFRADEIRQLVDRAVLKAILPAAPRQHPTPDPALMISDQLVN